MTARSRAPRPRRSTLLCAILAVLVACALTPPARAEGIPVGKWLFSPSVDALWQKEDNLFLESEEPMSGSSYTLRPRFRWELPFRESSVKVDYAPQMRQFVGRRGEAETGLRERYYSHFADLDAKLVFSNGLRLQVRDQFIIDTLETLNFDVGGEVPFNNSRYRRNRASLEAVKDVGRRHAAGVHLAHEFLDFDEEDEPFLVYDLSSAGLLYEYRLTPLSRLKGALYFGSVDRERGGVSSPQRARAFDSGQALVSLEGALGRHGLADASLGYVHWDFEQPSAEDFSGLSGEFRYGLLLSEQMRLTARISSLPLQSAFQNNNFYISRAVDLKLVRAPGTHLYYTATLEYRRNDYPEPISSSDPEIDGLRREDTIGRGEVGLGYKFNQALQAEVRYRRDRRDSNLEGVNYSSNRLIFQLSFGWY